jgi:hypothetical protein
MGTALAMFFMIAAAAHFLVGSYVLKGMHTVAQSYIRTMFFYISWGVFYQFLFSLFEMTGFAYLDQLQILGDAASGVGYVNGVHVLYLEWIGFVVTEVFFGEVLGYFNAFPGAEEFTTNRLMFITWGLSVLMVNITAHSFSTFFWPSAAALIMMLVTMVYMFGFSRVKLVIVTKYHVGKGKFWIPLPSWQTMLYFFFYGGFIAGGVLSILTNPYVNVIPQSILVLTDAGIRFIQAIGMLVVVYFGTEHRKPKSGFFNDLYPVYNPSRRVALEFMQAGIISAVPAAKPDRESTLVKGKLRPYQANRAVFDGGMFEMRYPRRGA